MTQQQPAAPTRPPATATTAEAWRDYLSQFLRSPAANQIDEIRGGIPAGTLLGAAAAMDVPRERFYELVGLSISTAKRKRVKNELLDPVVSERLTAIGAINRLAEEVFGTSALASAWLQTRNPGLGEVTPLSMLDTEIGRREVARLLHAIAYGAAA
ncbi:MAG: DUF2384 domain-containing protein [Rhodocyclaceae bacterium]|nr:DUF2384 domain-containing protein [Rhodocyclaceae bacterium]MBX3669938.1 DUF2384 domain-containing protein [Rhodocyclaceae bacterium]